MPPRLPSFSLSFLLTGAKKDYVGVIKVMKYSFLPFPAVAQMRQAALMCATLAVFIVMADGLSCN